MKEFRLKSLWDGKVAKNPTRNSIRLEYADDGKGAVGDRNYVFRFHPFDNGLVGAVRNVKSGLFLGILDRSDRFVAGLFEWSIQRAPELFWELIQEPERFAFRNCATKLYLGGADVKGCQLVEEPFWFAVEDAKEKVVAPGREWIVGWTLSHERSFLKVSVKQEGGAAVFSLKEKSRLDDFSRTAKIFGKRSFALVPVASGPNHVHICHNNGFVVLEGNSLCWIIDKPAVAWRMERIGSPSKYRFLWDNGDQVLSVGNVSEWDVFAPETAFPFFDPLLSSGPCAPPSPEFRHCLEYLSQIDPSEHPIDAQLVSGIAERISLLAALLFSCRSKVFGNLIDFNLAGVEAGIFAQAVQISEHVLAISRSANRVPMPSILEDDGGKLKVLFDQLADEAADYRRKLRSVLELVATYSHKDINEFCFEINNIEKDSSLSVCLLGDWGTGKKHAKQLLEQALKRNRPSAVVHLGDVYKIGARREQERRFIQPLLGCGVAPPMQVFDLPGNHCYFRPKGYFWALQQLRKLNLSPQTGSYFAARIEGTRFLLVGLDTSALCHSFESHALLTQLDKHQHEWVVERLRIAMNNNLRVVLLSHHPLLSRGLNDGVTVNKNLHEQLSPYFGCVAAWFWGHDHDMKVYLPQQGLERGRLIGHGAKNDDAKYANPLEFTRLQPLPNGTGIGCCMLTVKSSDALVAEYLELTLEGSIAMVFEEEIL